jgi:molecular chaperone DnaK (HSP70)
MLEAAEKARKIISSVSDSTINIDYLLEEEDLNFVLKREQFEAMIKPHTDKYLKLMLDTIEESGK